MRSAIGSYYYYYYYYTQAHAHTHTQNLSSELFTTFICLSYLSIVLLVCFWIGLGFFLGGGGCIVCVKIVSHYIAQTGSNF